MVLFQSLSKSGDDGVVEKVSGRAILRQHIYKVVAEACPRPRGRTESESRPILRTVDSPKDFGLSIGGPDHWGKTRVAKREPQIVENGHHHESTGHSRQTPNGVLSKSRLLRWFFRDHEERVASLFSSDAAERSKQPSRERTPEREQTIFYPNNP